MVSLKKSFFFLRSRLLDRASCRRLAELGCFRYMYMCLERPKMVNNEDICRVHLLGGDDNKTVRRLEIDSDLPAKSKVRIS